MKDLAFHDVFRDFSPNKRIVYESETPWNRFRFKNKDTEQANRLHIWNTWKVLYEMQIY